MEFNETYKQLTGVNIEAQRRVWDERGKGYYGEYLLFCELYKGISGAGKILMNLRIPADASHTTEIDLLLIHETGFYVFEIKHYKGTIYGKDTDSTWTQYFRTAKNNIFRNPMEQNGYHIRALKKLFPNTPIRSCIVFTSGECDIRVQNSNPEVDICLFKDVSRTLAYRFQTNNPVLSMEEIDRLFRQLAIYSPMKKPVVINTAEADFLTWVQPAISGLEQKKAELEQEKASWTSAKERLNKQKRKGMFMNAAIAVVCVIVSVAAVSGFHKMYELALQENDRELAEFQQNFLHVDEIGNEYIDALNSFVDVSNVSLQPLSDNAVSFTARLAVSNDVYGIALTENSKYIVMTDSGKVMEYDVFGEHLRYSRASNRIGTGIRPYGDLAPAQFYGVAAADISYIKLTGMELFKLDVPRTVVKDKLELELYSKE